MKKAVATTLIAMLAASAMCGCNRSGLSSAVKLPDSQDAQPSTRQAENNEEKIENNTEESGKRIQIIIDGSKLDDFTLERKKSPISGVRRHFVPDQSGNYTVEYIHTPYGMDKDETLDYKLSLNNDNTFELTVVSDGVTAEHNGRWYERRNQIILFYDEEIDPPQHNVYVADSMYAELLPKGKIMIYDNCYTIVLSKQQNEYETMPIERTQQQ